MKLTDEEQLNIMRGQLANFDTLLDKVMYLSMFFDPDPSFEKHNRDIIRGELCREKT